MLRTVRLRPSILAALAASLAAPALAGAQAPADSPPAYRLQGDLPEILSKGTLRILVPAGLDHLPRAGDPRRAEQELARAFAGKLGIRAIFIPVASLEEMIADLAEGRGDLVVASLAVTEERARRMAFSRPVRFVDEAVVVPAGESAIRGPQDLAGKTVVVRPSSSYAASLKALSQKVKDIDVRPAPEEEDTFSLIQRVARGELAATVADSDILAAARGFEPGAKAAFSLSEGVPIAWGLRKKAVKLKASLDAFLIEKAMSGHKDLVYRADLDEVKKRGVLRVLSRNSSTCYFLYRGEELGFEYELAREFARELGVRLEIAIPPDREALLTWLAEGRGDIVAAGLAPTEARQGRFAFSEPYNTVSELVALAAGERVVRSPEDLKGRKVTVRRSSSYFETLTRLREKIGFEIDLAPENLETEELLRQVARGALFATVADSNIVDVERTYGSALRTLEPLGAPVPIAWAMRKDQPQLKAAADAFHKRLRGGLFFNLTYNKYFKNPKTMRASAGDERSDREGQLSPFDALVKRYAQRYELDWRLVTAQMYQESHFDPKATSWVGAQGLMQVMPQTALELKIDNLAQPENGIHAGIKLLARYSRIFASAGVKEKDRIRFALAAYNCGPGHVHDARRLALDLKLDPDRWFNNVERAMQLLSAPEHARRARYGFCRCEEPVRYVSSIQSRYDSYARLATLD